MKDTLNKDILELFDLFESHGYELYLVGGCVRDYLRKDIVSDYDFTTSASPNQMIELLSSLDAKVIPTGIKHGTLTLRYHEQNYEITTYRSESNYNDHRRPDSVQFVSSLSEDLKRRDFTMNAICYNPSVGFIDPMHGIDDLNNNIIRCIGNPQERFDEDALRILRALRFSFRFHFEIETDTYRAIQQQAYLLDSIAKERIQVEWNQMLMCDYPMLLTALMDANVLYYISPSLKLLEIEHDNPWHIYDVFTHTDVVLSNTVGESLEYKLAAIYHDIGKQESKTIDEKGIAHFFGHPGLSISIAKHELKRLKYSTKVIDKVCIIIQYHDYHFPANEAGVRKFLIKLNQDTVLADEIIRFQLSDNTGKNPEYISKPNEEIKTIRDIIHRLKLDNSIIERSDLAIDGYDLIHLGAKNKQIGDLLDRSFIFAAMHPKRNNKEQLLQVVKQWINEERDE